VTILEFLSAAEAFASAAAEAEHTAPSINDLWFPLINFLIYAYIIVKFAVPPIRDFLRSRREEVVGKITRASAKKQAAQALVEEYRVKLAGLDTEVRSIQASLGEEGEREKAKLLSEAQAMAVKIREDGRFLADQEVKMARQKLREEMAEEAEATARQLVERNLSHADESRLVNDFVQTIGQPQ
jgi:F-type H+-transporting ATPase subunit b